jgi:hypothetical protein
MCQSCQDTTTTPLSLYIYIYNSGLPLFPASKFPSSYYLGSSFFFFGLEFFFIFIFFVVGGGSCARDVDEVDLVDLVVFGSYWAH